MVPSPYAADVFSHLRAAVARELQSPEVDALLADLVGRGWLPAELRHRVGGPPAHGCPERDAASVLGMLRQLVREPSPHEDERAGGLLPPHRAGSDRDRPACAVCATPSEFSVRTDVHLCARCVDVLAAGAVLTKRRSGT